ncbi:hypothetical protein C8Q80DRAFT_689982 [Daedaleopsis nitida]|nr:hypothetical protein C8Q80DRAFT_689982 [Daedaleopsis nitida]
MGQAGVSASRIALLQVSTHVPLLLIYLHSTRTLLVRIRTCNHYPSSCLLHSSRLLDLRARPRPQAHARRPLPANSVYTSCYCEENVYLLARAFKAQAVAAAGARTDWPWEICVVFVSNGAKTVRTSTSRSLRYLAVHTNSKTHPFASTSTSHACTRV